jgi:hypothetical protein
MPIYAAACSRDKPRGARDCGRMSSAPRFSMSTRPGSNYKVDTCAATGALPYVVCNRWAVWVLNGVRYPNVVCSKRA